MLGNVAVNQISFVLGGKNQSTGDFCRTCDFKMEHAFVIQEFWQSVHHPLMPDIILVDKGDRQAGARLDAPFVLVETKHSTGELLGIFASGMDLDFYVFGNLVTTRRKLVFVLTHDHSTVHVHQVSFSMVH